MKTTVLNKSKLTVKAQVLAVLASVAAAVALPQLAHLIGQYAGFGTSVGEIFLPMHLPVIIAGFIAGPVVGAVSGVMAPVISFALTGMPAAMALPFILVEVFTYGLVSGVLSSTKLNSFLKLIVTQLSGRAMRILAVVIATSVFGFEKITVSAVLSSMAMGLAGILIQWIVTLAVMKFERRKHE